jgi:hypothetical protein
MATTKLAADKMRVSYVEAVNTHKALTLLSAVTGQSYSELVREATAKLLSEKDPAGEFMKAGDFLSKKLPTSIEDDINPGAPIDQETAAVVRKLMGVIKR